MWVLFKSRWEKKCEKKIYFRGSMVVGLLKCYIAHTDRPSDEPGCRGAFAPNNLKIDILPEGDWLILQCYFTNLLYRLYVLNKITLSYVSYVQSYSGNCTETFDNSATTASITYNSCFARFR